VRWRVGRFPLFPRRDSPGRHAARPAGWAEYFAFLMRILQRWFWLQRRQPLADFNEASSLPIAPTG